VFCVVGHQRQNNFSAEEKFLRSRFLPFPNAESVKGKNVFSTNSTLFLVLKTASCFPFSLVAFHFIIPKHSTADCPEEFSETQQKSSKLLLSVVEQKRL
jgi:hypothetical protein